MTVLVKLTQLKIQIMNNYKIKKRKINMKFNIVFYPVRMKINIRITKRKKHY